MAVISSKSYTAGEVIFESKPIIHCIESDSKEKHCDNCLKKSDSLKKCSKCHQMFYCDEDCQRNDWIYHKNECKVFRHHNFQMSESTSDERLLLRLWLSFKFVPNFATKRFPLIDGTDVCLNEIRLTVEELTKDEAIIKLVLLLAKFKALYGLKCDQTLLFLLFGFVNSEQMCEPIYYFPDCPFKTKSSDFIVPIGSAIFISNPEVRHSCLPNTCLTNNGILSTILVFDPNIYH